MVARKLLLIDDDEDLREVVAAIAQALDVRMDSAEDGAQGVALARTGSPDLILLDLRMPDMDGFDVLRKLASNVATRDIPVCMLTASRDPEHVLRALQAGAADYLMKPIDPEETRRRLASMLERIGRAGVKEEEQSVRFANVGKRLYVTLLAKPTNALVERIVEELRVRSSGTVPPSIAILDLTQVQLRSDDEARLLAELPDRFERLPWKIVAGVNYRELTFLLAADLVLLTHGDLELALQ